MQGIQIVDDVPEALAATDGSRTPGSTEEPSATDDTKWLAIARDAYSTSTDYFDANIRTQLEKNVQMFRSKHPMGSKYHSDSYRFRSKIFRPKLRASIRKTAAACAVAFFSTADAVSVTAHDERDPNQRASAAINKELLNYRLAKTVPWFLTLVGGLVDAKVQGVVISKQFWEYEEYTEPPAEDGSGGMLDGRRVVVKDTPAVRLIPAENFRFSASSDWTNPVGSSPYLIEIIPMFITDIEDRIEAGDFLYYTRQEIVAAAAKETDTTRQARHGERQDASQVQHSNNQFDLVYVREYTVRHKGRDWNFMTLGDNLLLTEPMYLEEVYHHGMRPYAIGYIDIEPHKAYPSGTPELTEGLTIQANDIANQRLDNVKLALNKRYFGRRNATVDWDTLRRSIPGGIVMMDSFDDVKEESVQDVTGSSYQEQDRVNVDFDEIAGSFSMSSVASNRKLNETVGGMNLLSNESNALTEFELRVFSETWVETVLRQMVKLEQTYENDKTIMAIAADKANLYQKFGINDVTDEMLRAELTTTVNVGFGSTDPKSRIDKMALGLGAVGQFVPGAMQRLDEEAVIEEVMGALGHKDGSRFFKPIDPKNPPIPPQIQEQMQKMQEELQKLRSGVEVANIRARATVEAKQIDASASLQESNMRRLSLAEQEHIRGQYNERIAQSNAQLESVRLRISAADSETKRGELRLEAQALQASIAQQEREMRDTIASFEDSDAAVISRNDYGNVPMAKH